MSEITSLVVTADYDRGLTTRYDCDCHTALTRALCEYLEQIPLPGNTDSQKVQFEAVTTDWEDAEQSAKFPAAAVYTNEPGFYDDTDFTSHMVQTSDGQSLKVCAEFKQIIVVDVFTGNRQQRQDICKVLEDYFEPVDWMSGFRLKMPHYFGVCADFLKVSLDYQDSEDSASKRWRMAQFQFEAQVQQIKLLGELPLLQPKIKLTVNVV